MSKVRDLIDRAAAELQGAGIVSARTDAELLLAHALKVDRKSLATIQTVPTDDFVNFMVLVTKRGKRVPLQHLTGEAYFRHLTLQVGQGVFIPRPETELLVQSGLDFLANIDGPKLAVDLCSGSGAIALSIALESPDTTVHAVELSPEAFGWLEKNVAAYSQQLSRINSSVITYNDDATNLEVLKVLSREVDAVLSNPPYIPDEMIPREPEVRDHDPALALFGGQDGLDVARKVAHVAFDLLKPGGFFGMEHADVQGKSCVELLNVMTSNGQQIWVDAVDHNDYNQFPRFVTARRSAFSASGTT